MAERGHHYRLSLPLGRLPLLGGNMLHVFRHVEQVSHELQSHP